MVEKVAYKGWENCWRLSNNCVELIITGDVGPRIIRFGFIDDINEFGEYEDMLGKKGEDQWRIYGGHRLWHAPENRPRTYYPDNEPVKLEDHGEFVRVIQPTEKTTGIKKEMDIYLAKDKAEVKITHRLINEGLWPVELSVWALTVMRAGGLAIVPFPPRGPHPKYLLPTHSVILWAYTDFSDPRWKFMKKYLILQQDPNSTQPQKAGVMCKSGWCSYWNKGHFFIKRFEYKEDMIYPDLGSSVEIFTDANKLELETLSPLYKLNPSEKAEHIEIWQLFDNVVYPGSEEFVDNIVDDFKLPI